MMAAQQGAPGGASAHDGSTSDERTDADARVAEVPRVIDGRWAVETRIGYGAFGQVYRARDRANGDTVAVKVFEPRTDETGYLQELGLLFAEEHPNIVKTRSFGYTAGRKFIVYEYMRGGSLRDLLVRQPRLAPGQALDIVAQVARGLGFAHSKRVVHRDLKPENLLLRSADLPTDVLLCDFGLSTRLSPGRVVRSLFGSPAYMAPEQFVRDYDHRVDFYALGIILYEMLYGRRPFAGDEVSLRHAHIYVAPPLPEEGPSAIIDLLRRMLAKDPDERYPDADSLRHAIDLARGAITAGYAATPTQSAPTPTEARASWELRLRRRAVACAGAGDSIALHVGDRIVSVGPDAAVRPLARASTRVARFVECCGVPSCIGWIGEGRLWIASGGSIRSVASCDDDIGRVVASPESGFAALTHRDAVRLLDVSGGTTVWRADISNYGTFPEVSFSGDGSRLWIAGESPRSQLSCLTLEGKRSCRTPAGVADVALVPGPGQSVVVGGRGRAELRRIDSAGFLRAEGELAISLVDLFCVGEEMIAAVSAEHIELLNATTLRSVSLQPIPAGADVVEPTSAGVYVLGLSAGVTEITFSPWPTVSTS